ncbi:hypothetical protein PAP_04520 [Palaeococcus pacificus DY20341]|uniref:Chemotaxis protein CheA n=1 Tax=Palaeococcus pacificus DY20341 TaxID=1343739 RepID=A0A075LRF2_9EURY|nr:chemotaxis protein CheA [Palaeococcus pacificus]AIF69315.1 hypothetical protein PAP_04520 [Palaeococcus pacificus DY20341]
MELSQYLEEFLADAKERIDNLNNAFLKLEAIITKGEGNGKKKELIDQIFRDAHTLKGTAATMGFDELSEVAHKVENLFDDIREDRIDLNSDIFDVVFEVLDVIGEMIESIERGEEHNFELEELYKKLEWVKNNAHKKESSIQQSSLKAEAKKYRVRVFFDKNNSMRGVRAFLILTDLGEIGEILKTVPERSEIEEGKLEGDLAEYEILTDKPVEDVEALIRRHPEIIDIKIDTLSENEEKEEQKGAKRVEIYLQRDAPLKSARIFLILEDLTKIGEISNLNSLKRKLETEEFDEEKITLFINTHESEEKIKELIMKHPYVEEVKLEESKSKSTPEKVEEQKNASKKTIQKIKMSQVVKINVNHLDKLMDLMSELVINKGRLDQIAEFLDNKELLETLSTTSRLMSELQEEIMQMRLVSLAMIFNKFPRMIRDLAKESGKEIELIMEGQDIEVDRSILDKLSDILVHLLRNAVDHGIELPEEREKMGKPRVGKIKLVAERKKNRIEITVSDDGKGIDPEKIKQKAITKGLLTEASANAMSKEELINLIFMPGFSTAEKVTKVSGRGVGLDVVHDIVKSLNGSLIVQSEVGKGTTFVVRLPISTAIIQALLIQVKDEIYALPISNIIETREITKDDIQTLGGRETIVLRGEIIPIYMLHELIGLPCKNIARFPAIIVDLGSHKIAIGVDGLLNKRDIVIKPLGKVLSRARGFSGATILGDGRVVLIIDVNSLLEGAMYGRV